MLELKALRENPELVRASQRARGENPELVDRLLEADAQRRASITRFDTLRAEQKALGKSIPQASGEEKAALLARTKDLAAEVKDADAGQGAAESAFQGVLLQLSNVIEDGVPPGGEDDFVTLEEVGKPPEFDFEPRDHLDLGELLGAIDTRRATKVSGARFFYLTGIGARLELALVNFAFAQALEHGFTPMIPPALVKPAAMEGTGFLGQAAENVYRLPDDDMYLVGTSEVPLAAYHMDEILDAGLLPLRYAALSPCFRREAGSYGKDTRGIIRVHQFDKVEMFSFVAPEDARDEHRRLLAWEREFFDQLEIPYRVIDVAAGDLGASAARKFDIEAWIPTQGKYREVTSTSNCTTFQARRLNIRMRDSERARPLATLNGTLVAVPRTIVAVLENHQRADGSVRVPEALRPYLGGLELIEPPGS